ncbi:MAG: hypothetical protein IJL40_05460, partial [Oscillospiraceae bacterium]|nr:hypothetical protein [Oscillospiraceae bacterium]
SFAIALHQNFAIASCFSIGAFFTKNDIRQASSANIMLIDMKTATKIAGIHTTAWGVELQAVFTDMSAVRATAVDKNT